MQQSVINRLSGSNACAQFSEQMVLAATPMIAVLWLNAGAAASGMLQALQTLPFLLLSLPIGLLADRYSRQRLMVMAELLRVLGLVLLGWLVYHQSLSLAGLLSLSFLLAITTVVYSVALPALVQSVVKPEYWLTTNRRIELLRSLSLMAGPVLGGLLVSWSGPWGVMGCAALLSMLAVGGLWLLRDTLPQKTAASQTLWQALSEGGTFLLSHVWLRPILLTALIFNLAWFLLQAIFVLYLHRQLSMSTAEIGLMMGIFGSGMLVGAMLSNFLGRRCTVGTQLLVGPLSAWLAAGLIALTIFIPSPLLVGLSQFIFGLGPVIWSVSTTTLRQQVTPAALMARVSAVLLTVTWGARPLGALLGAVIGERYGLEPCLLLVLVGFTGQAILLLASPLKQIRDVTAPPP